MSRETSAEMASLAARILGGRTATDEDIKSLAASVLSQREDDPQGEFSIGGALWPGLSKLIEEAGEVCQVAGKIIGNEGRPHHWDGSYLPKRLTDELADLMAAIMFVGEMNGLDNERMGLRTAEKLELFHQWHRDTVAARAEKSA